MAGVKVPLVGDTEPNNPVYGYPVPTKGTPLKGRNKARLPGEGGDEFPWSAEGIGDRLKRIQLAELLNALGDVQASQETGVPAPEGIASMLAERYAGGIPSAVGPVITSEGGRIAMSPKHRNEHPEIGFLASLLGGGYGQ